MALVSLSQAAAILGVSDDARPVLNAPRAQVERPTFVIETVHLRNLLEEREERISDLEAAVESLGAELLHHRDASGLSSVRERELIRAVHQGQVLHAQALGIPVRTTAAGELTMAAPASPASGEAGDGGPATDSPPWWRRRRGRQTYRVSGA
jgi:hypothetical protein